MNFLRKIVAIIQERLLLPKNFENNINTYKFIVNNSAQVNMTLSEKI